MHRADVWKRKSKNSEGKMNKYHNKKTRVHGMEFDSAKEAKRYQELYLMGKCGYISDLRTQVKFELIPAQYEYIETGGVYLVGIRKGMPKTKKVCVEKAVCYIADFVYMKNGKMVVEDTKSEATRTKEYIIKRKLLRYLHGITVKEV